MDKPKITTLDGQVHEMRKLTGRDWRLLGEFTDNASNFFDADLLEKHAAFTAQFYDGVTADDILDLPLDDIMPASYAVRNYISSQLGAKLEKIEKNAEADKVQ